MHSKRDRAHEKKRKRECANNDVEEEEGERKNGKKK